MSDDRVPTDEEIVTALQARTWTHEELAAVVAQAKAEAVTEVTARVKAEVQAGVREDLAAVLANASAGLLGMADEAEAEAAAEPRPERRRKGVPPAPVLLADLPLITKGPFKGERWMTPRQFARHFPCAVANVYDLLYTKQLGHDEHGRPTGGVKKLGNKPQSRVLIASGERERRRPPIVNRRQAPKST